MYENVFETSIYVLNPFQWTEYATIQSHFKKKYLIKKKKVEQWK